MGERIRFRKGGLVIGFILAYSFNMRKLIYANYISLDAALRKAYVGLKSGVKGMRVGGGGRQKGRSRGGGEGIGGRIRHAYSR